MGRLSDLFSPRAPTSPDTSRQSDDSYFLSSPIKAFRGHVDHLGREWKKLEPRKKDALTFYILAAILLFFGGIVFSSAVKGVRNPQLAGRTCRLALGALPPIFAVAAFFVLSGCKIDQKIKEKNK